MQLHVFGPLAAVCNGAEVSLPLRNHSRHLLARLAIDVGVWLDRDMLALEMWPSLERSLGRQKLRRHLFDVRAWLNKHCGDGVLMAQREKVRLVTNPALQIDLFESPLYADGALGGSQVHEWLLGTNITLLEGIDELWVQPHRTRIRRKIDEILPKGIDDLVADDRLSEAYYLAQHWCEFEPTSERRYRVLMWLSSRLGDTGALRRWFAKCQDELAREHGIAVSARTEAFFKSIVQGVVPAWENLHSAGFEAEPHGLNRGLPSWKGELFGRRETLNAIQQLLSRSNRVTIVGTGGVGKTALATCLAQNVVDRYRDGVNWVDLAGIDDPKLLAQFIVESIGIDAVPGREPVVQLRSYLAQHRVLFVLDNCEHLLDAIKTLVERIWDGDVSADLLATSRIPIGFEYEHVWNLEPLSCESTTPGILGPALQLLIERVRQSRNPDEFHDSELPAALRVSELLDGIPLAMELAAARCEFLDLHQVADMLAQYFNVLVDSRRDRATRQSTMWSAIDWSWQLLEQQHRDLLTTTAVFRGGFDTRAAVELERARQEGRLPEWSDSPPRSRSEREQYREVADQLEWLVRNSLIAKVTDARQRVRFRLLEPIRHFAEAKMVAEKRDRAASMGHIEYFAQLAIAARGGLSGEERPRWNELLKLEHDNLRHAMAGMRIQEDAQQRLQVGTSLFRYWYASGHFGWELDWLRASVAQREPFGPDETVAEALHLIGICHYAKGECVVALEFFSRSSEQYSALQDDASIVRSMVMCAYCHTLLGEIGKARSDANRALTLANEDPALSIQALDALGYIDRISGHYTQSRESMMRVLDLHRDSDSTPDEQYSTISNLGWIAWSTGALDEATDWLHEARMIAETIDSKPMRLEATVAQIEVLVCYGRLEEAALAAREGVELAKDLGDGFGEANALTMLGIIELAKERWPTARLYLRRADSGFRAVEAISELATVLCYAMELTDRMGDETVGLNARTDDDQLPAIEHDPHAQAMLHRSFAWRAWTAGDHETGLRTMVEALRMHVDLGERFEALRCFEAVGSLLARLGRGRLAEGALAAAAALRDEIGARPWPVDVTAVAAAREAIREAAMETHDLDADDELEALPVGAEDVVAWLERELEYDGASPAEN